MSTVTAKLNRSTINAASLLTGIAIALIVVTGLIHLIEGPDNMQEATYKGVMFFLNAGAALVAAVGIYRGQKSWGWGLGFLVAGGALVMYVVSRTIGLPGLGVDDDWFEPIGVLSVVVEAAFVIITLVMATRYRFGASDD